MPALLATLFLAGLLAAGYLGALPPAVPLLYIAASVAALAAYGVDKSSARRGLRRTPESTLHALALAGGWPGALIAQALFRHKTQKQPFRAVLWATVILNCTGLTAILLAGRV